MDNSGEHLACLDSRIEIFEIKKGIRTKFSPTQEGHICGGYGRWQKLKLERHMLGPGETPYMRLLEPLIVLNLAQDANFQLRIGRKMDSFCLESRHFNLNPKGLVQIFLERECRSTTRFHRQRLL